MCRMWMLFVSLLCLVYAAEAQTADGPYIMYQEDGSVRMVSVTPEGRIVDTILASLPEDYGFTVVSSDQEHCFDVSLHPVERPDWKTEQPDRIFVTSDPHGNIDCFISLLQGNGVIDADCNWSFGTNQLVVIGDVFDRGNDAVQILWLIYQLEAEAAQAGGRVDYLLGNHEPMVLMNDLRYAKPKYTQLADTLGMKYADLLSPSSELGRWLSVRNTMQMSGRCLFVHAGLSSDFYRRPLQDQGGAERGLSDDILSHGQQRSSVVPRHGKGCGEVPSFSRGYSRPYPGPVSGGPRNRGTHYL